MKRYTLLVAVLALLAVSCMKDKGSYDYTAVNRVQIKGIDSSYNVDLGARLIIRPTLTMTDDPIGDTANYSYKWVVDHAIGFGAVGFIISTQHDLDTAVAGLRLSAGSYSMYYRVTDKKTGIFTDSHFLLTMTTASYEGWLLLCDTEDGNSRLDMISHAGNHDTLYRNILQKMQSTYVATGKPAYVATGIANVGGPAIGFVTTFVATSKKAVVLGANALDYFPPSYDMNTMMYISDPFTDWSNAKLYLSNLCGMLYANRNLYNVEAFSINGPVNTRDGGTALFTPSAWVGIDKQQAFGDPMIVFDSTSGTFLRYPGLGSTCLTLPAGDLFNFSTGMELLYMTYVPFSGGQVFAVLKDRRSEKRYLACFTLTGKQNYYAEISGEGISAATQFAVSPDLGYLFYDVGGKVYEYDPVLKQALLMHDYGASTISLMKFQPFASIFDLALNAEYYKSLEKKLLVCTYTKGVGMLDLYTVPEINGQIQLYRSYPGTGKVVSLAYRER
ncbi:MAG TPA: PKD-like family lipoprotein [Chitinophaga sp.]|uniref:PKD-like family lipoprotein n=1 Tax=Chitinophaga sp. TaxID=1869181 RepID=UPI002D042C0E|nr:PKD-like family lipoprotein [Chitinophaga sp.]HVI44130.1 PKD-like family lipoprotein [Chitinophaga sp.]